MQQRRHMAAALFCVVAVASSQAGKTGSAGPLTPGHTTSHRGSYTIETVGDTLGQASAQNTRLIIRVSGPEGKLVKPASVALVDRAGAAMKPVFRQDRKVGHEENTGLPVSMNGGAVGLDLKKIFGSHGDYAYTKVDWPKSSFTSDKSLQIALPNGQTLNVPLTAIAK
jgi:hypothetical protein